MPPATWTIVIAGLFAGGCAGPAQMMAVNAPLADLRAKPGAAAQPGVHDPLQETQLLYGERVRVLKVDGEWAQVEAIQQPEYTHDRSWSGYPGWVPIKMLVPAEPLPFPTIVVTDKWAQTFEDSYATRPSRWRFPLGTYLRAVDMGGQLWRIELIDGLRAWMPTGSARALHDVLLLPPAEKRRFILRSAALFLGDPYFWGGRSPATPDYASGVDCSGLVSLAYRSVGMDLPRDAHEQWMRASPVASPKPADLIFLSEQDNPKRIVHVMLYEGDNQILEGPGTGGSIRRVSAQERFGRKLNELEPGAVIDGQTIAFGSYLP